MLDIALRLRGVAMISGAAMAGWPATIDVRRLGALSGPCATAMSTLDHADVTRAAILLGLAALSWFAASARAGRRA